MQRSQGLLFGVLGFACVLQVSGVIANPDEGTIPGMFVRGDTNNDGKVNISDAAHLLNFLFAGGLKPTCYEAGDIDDDGGQDLSDAVFLLRFLFLGETPPPTPYPVCDFDPGKAPCIKSLCNG